MIGALAAATLIAAAPGDPTPHALGRASFFTGVCMGLGWEGSRERAVAYGEAYDARNPTHDMEGRQAEIRRGIYDARADFLADVDALRATSDAAAFKAAVAKHCDGVARDIPEMLGRTDATPAAFEAAVAEIIKAIADGAGA